MLPDLRLLLTFLFVEPAFRSQLQVRLQIPQRTREVVQMVRKQAAIAELALRRRVDRQKELGGVARLGEGSTSARTGA